MSTKTENLVSLVVETMCIPSCIDKSIVLCAGLLFLCIYFFRVSVAAISDKFEQQFDATASDIGLMMALHWFGYSISQIPLGVLIQYITSEFVIFIAALLMLISIPLVGFNRTNLIYAYIIFFITGIAASPTYLCFIKTISVRLSNNAIPLYAGIIVSGCAITAAAGRYLQSWLYDEYDIWYQTYFILGCVIAIFYISFIILLKLEWDTTSLKYRGINKKRTYVSSYKSTLGGSKTLTGSIKYTANKSNKYTLSSEMELEPSVNKSKKILQLKGSIKTTPKTSYPMGAQESSSLLDHDDTDAVGKSC